MHDDQSGDLFGGLQYLFERCAPATRRPAPRVRRLWDDQGRPVIMISQRDDTLLVAPADALKLARRLFHVARSGGAAHGRLFGP
jgi:hypothetical protein